MVRVFTNPLEMALLKVLICVLLVTVAVADEEDSGQYSPEKYEKPYETEEVSPTTTAEEIEAAETPEPAEVEDPAPAEIPLPEVTAADPAPVPKIIPLALPYPLLYNSLSAPVIYSDPEALRFANTFPVIVV